VKREFYIDLARRGLRMPIGTDLVLHEHADAGTIRNDGKRLGEVIVDAARRYRTPLAVPLMDLTREKSALLEMLGVPVTDAEYHLTGLPTPEALARFDRTLAGGLTISLRAHVESIAHVATVKDLVTVGMCIGPFSLMTKLLSDPITPVYLAGSGISGKDDPEVKLMETCLELSTKLILRVIQQQIDAGAKMMMIAEPAANKVFFSPMQMDAGSDVFEQYAMASNRRIRQLLTDSGVELFFHCCGELTDPMVKAFGSLDPAILSLGSSRQLWQDAKILPESTVIYGNLPSKQFYSDSVITVGEVTRRARELAGRMADVHHPFILGTECDVLSVPGCECAIQAKVDALMVP